MLDGRRVRCRGGRFHWFLASESRVELIFETQFEDPDPQSDSWVEVFSEGQVFPCLSDEQAEIPMEICLSGSSFDPQSAKRVEILRLGSDG